VSAEVGETVDCRDKTGSGHRGCRFAEKIAVAKIGALIPTILQTV
jgi:hypothetical protein